MVGSPTPRAAHPRRTLSAIDAIAIIIGVVVGAGIFRAPPLIAAGADSALGVALLWGLGGLVSLCGALCYGELVAAFPDPGGEYHFLTRAFGRGIGFLFAWARLMVIATGSIALLAFIFGDYAATILPLGERGSALYATGLVVVLTGINALGLRAGTSVQNASTLVVVTGLVAMAVAGLVVDAPDAAGPAAPATSSMGLAMVFVLLTFGGWNEAAYLSAELRGGRRRIVLVMVAGVGAVTALYLLVNLAYLRALGLSGLRGSDTVAADLIATLVGPIGAVLASALIAAAALTSANATIVTGSRTAFALGRDFRVFGPLGRWDPRAEAPLVALLVQGGVVIVLIALGALTRRGFETIVAYTAPVFWGFFLLTGLALFVLRAREPGVARPFRVPLYPLIPLLFCASCAWLLHASLAHTGVGAVVGVLVLAAGAVPLWRERVVARSSTQEKSS